MKSRPGHRPPEGSSGSGDGVNSEGRGWLRVILGLGVAAALVTGPLWWEAAGMLVRAGPLAPAWPWLVPALCGVLVATVTLLGPLPARRRRPERRIDRLEVGSRPRAGAEASATPRVALPAASPVSALSAPPPPEPARHPDEQEGEAEPSSDTERAPGAGGAPVTVIEAGAFAKAVQQARESVALEGGVYRVRERLYGSRGEPRRSLRRIAESVITDDKIARLATAGQSRAARTPVTGDGLNYDQLLAQFPDPVAGETRSRVLEAQRIALQADAAVLLARGSAGYSASLATGSPGTPGTLALTAGDLLYDEYLRTRRYLLAGPGSDVCSSLPFAAARVALVPATLDGRRAYLLFAAATPDGGAGEPGLPWSPETLIERLNLHP